LSNKNAFGEEPLSGNRYLVGDKEACISSNVTVGVDNLCVYEKFMNRFELYYVNAYSPEKNKMYAVLFEIDNVGSAATGKHTLFLKYNGLEEDANWITEKILVDIQ
jgi:hypothetical protein